MRGIFNCEMYAYYNYTKHSVYIYAIARQANKIGEEEKKTGRGVITFVFFGCDGCLSFGSGTYGEVEEFLWCRCVVSVLGEWS